MKILSYKDTSSYYRKHNVLVELKRALNACNKKIKLFNKQIKKIRKEKSTG